MPQPQVWFHTWLGAGSSIIPVQKGRSFSILQASGCPARLLVPQRSPGPITKRGLVLILRWPCAFIMLHTGVCVQVWDDYFCGMKINQVSSRASDVGLSSDASDLLLNGGR